MYTSKYGQVNWNGFVIPLPQEIITAWENRTMNIVVSSWGYGGVWDWELVATLCACKGSVQHWTLCGLVPARFKQRTQKSPCSLLPATAFRIRRATSSMPSAPRQARTTRATTT
eukprot:SAG22_NODE_787_length_7239_cov_4.418487_5_plen_114_part_00